MASSERASIPPQPFATVKQPLPQEKEKSNAVKVSEACDVCGKEFSTKTHLRGHFMRNHPFYPYRKRHSQTQCSLNRSAHLKNALAMESTKQSQTQPETLTKPGQEKTTTTTSNTSVVCNICGRKYPNETRLRGHYIRDHPSWPCPIPA